VEIRNVGLDYRLRVKRGKYLFKLF